MTKYIIFTIGLPGAGKTKLIDETLNHLNISEKHTLFSIDQLVESDPSYKGRLLKDIKDSNIKVDINKACTDASYNNLYNAIKSSDAYLTSRRSHTLCNNLSYDTILSNKIKKFKGDIGIIEGTGVDIPTIEAIIKVIDNKYKDKKHEIIFSAILADLNVLQNNNYTRACNSLKEFTVDKTKNAPRFVPNNIFNKSSNNRLINTIEYFKKKYRTLVYTTDDKHNLKLEVDIDKDKTKPLPTLVFGGRSRWSNKYRMTRRKKITYK